MVAEKYGLNSKVTGFPNRFYYAYGVCMSPWEWEMHALISSIRTRMLRAAGAGVQRIAAIRGRDPILWLIICGCLLVTAIIVGTIAMVGEFRERALSNSERELENTVQLLSRHFEQQFEDCDVIAANLISQMQLSAIPSAEEFKIQMSTPDGHEMLRSKASVSSYIGSVNIFDADGQLINSADTWPLPSVNISDRNYFKTFKSDPQAMPILTEPVLSAVSGRWTTVVAHRLSGPNGVFLGIISRRIDAATYENFFSTVALGSGAAIAMFHADGTLLARFPHVDEMIGRKFATAPVLQSVLAKGSPQTLRVQSPIDQTDRIGSGAMLGRFPMVVIVTKSVPAALADWRAQTRFLVAVAVLCVSVIALIFFLIIRQIARQNHESQQRLEIEKQRLDTALNNMTQGLVLYDASARVVTTNQRYLDLHYLSADLVKPGLPFRGLIQLRKDTGTFDGDVDEFCSSVMHEVKQGRVHHRLLECDDGRAFMIVNKPLPKGGWVATIEDITERRNIEQERDRNYAFLREIIDHIPSQITVKDARTRQYVLANEVAETLFGLSRSEIIGKTPRDVFAGPMADRVYEDDDRSLQSGDNLFIDEERWESRTLGSRVITSTRIVIRDQAAEPRYIINVVEDVTERRRADEQIAHLAHYDALTDLPNRILFRERIERELKRAAEGAAFALLYIDVDEFKAINDSLGHHVGDELLKTIASRIRACTREDDLVARLGGDEFAVIKTAIRNAAEVEQFVSVLYEAIRRPCLCLGHQLSTNASIGIALAPVDGIELDQLTKNADLAMYAAKSGGRRTYRFFEPAMGESAKARLTMEQDLRQALASGGFEIHYQPLVELGGGEVTGCEALLRWRHPERGMISPAEFIPIAEDAGLIDEIGDWVLRTACAEAATWPDHIRIAVNVSPIQLKCQTLAIRIARALATSGLRPDRLELEITEAVLIRDDEAALAILHQLRSIGVRIALDDFGTGYSSLSYLKRFPFDKIKIDRCFVSDLNDTDGSSSIVRAVVNIAAALNMTTVAEGVETGDQRELLSRLGCTEMQGYLFSAPKPAAEVRPLFAAASAKAAAVA
jgi:diguanylate cyclase (GGDEF)-like protein/PAS domain S-box-containing protein